MDSRSLNLAPQLTSCGVLPHFEPQFPHLSNGLVVKNKVLGALHGHKIPQIGVLPFSQ